MHLLTIVAALALVASANVHARPMHAAIEPHYHRYLEERADMQVEYEAWMNKFKDSASVNGWIPVSEARSADEEQEDHLQRFFLTKQKIKEMELENPDAQFSTDSPFTLLTDDEFNAYVGNAYRKADDDDDNGVRRLRGAYDWSYEYNWTSDDGYDPESSNADRREPFETDDASSENEFTGNEGDAPLGHSNLPVAPEGDDTVDNGADGGKKLPVSPEGDDGADDTNANDAGSGTQGSYGIIDWTRSRCMSPIQNQGQCGSCWAFASIAAVESMECILSDRKTLPKYSEQQLTSCNTRNDGCDGGAPRYAFQYIQQNGLCTQRAYPYTSSNNRNSECNVNDCERSYPVVSGTASVSGENGLVRILKQHPVVVAVAAGNSAWKQYEGGVLSSCETSKIDHIVLAVGYDESTIKIRNSWGTRWGESGYIRLRRGISGDGACSVLSDISYPEME
uniref:Peptidase C1A papain C-terminal domain-containing protein n=1 Tax=Globisporangium ultimum (strain ATCC 200006 / CBS 805.95 / DAOM BR144) TaxID=431595 RepID=K3XA12_GLOUD